jgi:endonuclease YncB( thermonuclease family)
MLNEKMLADGYAATLPISPNLRYQDRFSAVTTKAAAEGRGIWSRISFARASESKLPPKKKAHHD